jgi:hypothetical protein
MRGPALVRMVARATVKQHRRWADAPQRTAPHGGVRNEEQAMEDDSINLQTVRQHAADTANAEDASLWRWFSALLEERRIRWCVANSNWLVSVDHRHLATSPSFDCAVREAKLRAEQERANRARSGRAGSAVSLKQSHQP